MSKNAILITLAVVMLAVAGLLLVNYFSGPGGERGEVIRKGPVVPVVCVNSACGAEPKDVRAMASDNDWPKACPTCGEKTLYRSVPCFKCGALTPQKPDGQGRIYCSKPNCGAWLNPPPGGVEGSGATP